jgi:predicted Zn-dependent protease
MGHSLDIRADLEAIARRALAFAKADETRVIISSDSLGQTRFAGGEITTSGGSSDRTVTVRSSFGKRSASASTNVTDDESLQRTVDLAERLAKLSPEDPESLPEPGPQQYATIQAYDQRTADLDAERRAAAVSGLISAAKAVDAKQELFVAGYLEATANHGRLIANSKGLMAFHASTEVSLSNTVRTPDGTGSGWASAGARDWGRIDAVALGRRAAQKAVASQNPVAIEPGRYTVILEPQAVADLVPLLRGALSARTAEEGRSPFSRRATGQAPARGQLSETLLGEKIADERVTIFSDPADPEIRGTPFDNEGLPTRRRVWVENGVLKSLAYDRFWAQKRGVPETEVGGFGGGLKMVGGSQSLEELIASTPRGILVTRNWYIRALDPRTASYTGLTRDGTFLIENGKIARSVKNFRWNESPLLMLNRVLAIGQAERVAAGIVMPALKIADFNFASISEAV